LTETAEYTGTIAWKTGETSFTGGTFAASTAYTAVVTLTPKPGYTFTGVTANAFSYAGANPVTNDANDSVVTVVFAATAATVSETNLTTLFDAPAAGGTPAAALTATDQYTGTIAWKVGAGDFSGGTFAAGTVYTAVVTLTPKPGYTFAGVTANAFSYAGATSVTNGANGSVATVVFAATAAMVSATNLTTLFAAPSTGGTPAAALAAADQYTGTIAWKTGETPFTGGTFAGSTVYTAVVSLTAKSGYTFTGVAENAFSYAGATSVTNGVNGSVVTVVFAATPAPVGSVNASIGFGPQAIEVTGNNGTNAVKQGQTLNLSVSGFDTCAWYLDGGGTAVGTSASLALDTTGYAVRPHTLTFTGTRGGIPYAQVIPFTVTAAGGGGGQTASTAEYVTYNSLADLSASLEAATANTTSNPYKVKLGSGISIADIIDGTEGMEKLYKNCGGKYIDLNLSDIDDSDRSFIGRMTYSPANSHLLVKLTLPDGVRSLGAAFLNCVNLVWVKWHDGESGSNAPRVSNECFKGCTNLAKVELPANIYSISSGSFGDCPALVTLVINSAEKMSNVDANSFNGTTVPENIMVYVPDGSVSVHNTTGSKTLNKAGIQVANIRSINVLADPPGNWQ
jgi:hypothetical protein